MFASSSRYAQVPTAVHVDPTGRRVTYVKLRLVPAAPASLRRHAVVASDRLDHLAFGYYRDAEQYWRICDANLAIWPDDLLAQPGAELVVPLGAR